MRLCAYRRLDRLSASSAFALAVLLQSFALADVSAAEERFCIAGVPGSRAFAGPTSNFTAFSIPGMSGPVFTSTAGVSIITPARLMRPYEGSFPRGFFDRKHWVIEPWSGRTLGRTFDGSIISVLRAGRFEPLEGTGRDLFVLPRRKLTIAVGNGSRPYIVDEHALTPWMSPEEMQAVGIDGMKSLHDSPLLGATIIRDQNNRLHAHSDDGSWHRLAKLPKGEYGRLFDAPRSEAAVFLANRTAIAIWKNEPGSSVRFKSRRLPATGDVIWHYFHPSEVFGELLTFQDGGLFDRRSRWRRLTRTGFVDIPGGDIGRPPGRRKSRPSDRIKMADLPALGLVLLEGKTSLHVYDGKKILPVIGSDRKDIGNVYPVPSSAIGRTLIKTRQSLFELTSDRKLRALKTPPFAGSLSLAQVIDWPASKVVLLRTEKGVFALDRNLEISTVEGSELIRGRGFAFAALHPKTGDMALAGDWGFALVIDTLRSGKDVCRRLL